MKNHIPFLFCLLTLASCTLFKSNHDGDSIPRWAHHKPEALTASLLGRFETQKKNLIAKKNLMICVETSRSDYDATELVLDVKLAFAAWIHASQIYGADEFSALDFKPQKLCPISNADFAANVVIATKNISQIADHANEYGEAKVSCTLQSEQLSCQGEGQTFGFGGVGNYGVKFVQSNGKWLEVIYQEPSTTSLSPFVKWNSLRTTLEQSELAKDVKKGLVDRYNALKQNASYQALIDLLDALKRHEVLDNDDAGFREKMNEMMQSEHHGDFSFTYVPSHSALHILIHEIGHQFGMTHAHEANENTITGTVKTGVTSPDKPAAIEIDAVMAYGQPYLYLTADDIAGVEHAAAATRQYIEEQMKK